MGGMSREEWNKRLEAEHNRRNAEEFRVAHNLDPCHDDNSDYDAKDLERHLRDMLIYTDCFTSSLSMADVTAQRFQRTFSDDVRPAQLRCCNHCIN